MRTSICLSAFVALLLLPTRGAQAQVVVLETTFGGELTETDRELFRDALDTSVRAAAGVEVVGHQDTRAAVGDLSTCEGGDCAVSIGLLVSASIAVRAELYAEAEIYDFKVEAYDLNTGETLVSQTGDCTFCPVNEAVDAFGFTVQAAVAWIDPFPAPSRGPERTAEPVASVVEATTEPEPPARSRTPTPRSERPEPPPAEPRPPREPRPARTSSFNHQAVGGVLLGTGAAAAIGGIVMLARDGKSTCSDGPLTLCEEVWEFTVGGATLTALGGIAIGTAVGLLVTGGRQDSSADASRGRFAFSPTRSGGTVLFQRSF